MPDWAAVADSRPRRAFQRRIAGLRTVSPGSTNCNRTAIAGATVNAAEFAVPNDGALASASATTVIVVAARATRRLKVETVNEPPVIANDPGSVSYGSSVVM